MNKLLLTAVALTSFCATSMAVAGGPDQAHRGGFYLGTGVGFADLYVDSYDYYGQPTYYYTPVHVAGRTEAGYLFARTDKLLVGLETGFNYLPQDSDTVSDEVSSVRYNSNVYAFDLLGVVKYYVSPRFNFFGKFGGAYVHSSATETSTWGGVVIDTYAASTNSFMPELALGIGCNITPKLELTIAMNNAIGWEGNYPSYNLFVAGLDYHFSS